ncbi:MAG: hypothetical protein HYV29_10435 [Ignavibacteriales bacterium]|nr:hypothetical protein [Ignavibacteriales bacterium]
MRLMCLVVAAVSLAFSQQQPVFVQRENSIAIVAGMGVDLVNAPEIVEYVNSTAAYGQTVDDFATAVDFFGGVEFPVGKEWGIKVEHMYLFKSYNFLSRSGATHDFFYAVHAPSLLIQKVVGGEGYFVKMGAGGGYHFGRATETISTFGTSRDYTASGVGLKAEIVGQTAFDENFFGYIGGQLGWEWLGKFLGTDATISLVKTKELRYFYAGLRFGVTYYL